MPFEGVPHLTIEFDSEDLDGLTIDIRVAEPDLNPLFAAACVAYIQPLQLAASLPEDHPRYLSEETAERALAKAYSMAIPFGSNDPALAIYSPAEWEAWLLAHRVAFQGIRDVAECRELFVPDPERIAGAAVIEQAVELGDYRSPIQQG